ncbi:MAG TPA: C40 family peptidase [Ignavibacteriaceae bacterium]|nr:C40 family peptidase [Ignavibacteriaceae bacterium]
MKKIILSLLLLSSVIFAQGNKMNEVQKVIDDVRNQYAPDKRTAIFDVQVTEENGNIVLSGATNLVDAKNELSNKLSSFKVTNKIETLPAKELGNKIYGVVPLSVANLRVKPGHSEEMATQALLGMPVLVYKQRGGNWLVKTPDDYIAWIDELQLMDKSEYDNWMSSQKVIYTEHYGMSYSEKNEKSIPVSDLVAGDILKYLAKEDSFYKVEYPDKRIAYVPEDNAEMFDSYVQKCELTPENILHTAKSLMGVPYLWGGTSTKGVDCSGFTKTVYFLNGVILPRDASQQVFSGDSVDITNGYENLQPGDLVFFGARARDGKKERVSHVGIYLGNMEFIHSSGSVRINSFDKEKDNFSEYRTNSLLKAKRIINAKNLWGIKPLKDISSTTLY